MLDSGEPGDVTHQACVRIVEAHRDHPLMTRWFRSITTFEVPTPGLGVFCFPAIELRDGPLAAAVWSDGPDTWGTGGWHPLTSAGGLPLYLNGMRPVVHGRGFAEILELLESLRRDSATPRPWWKFW
jgi:hypothetical protein